MSNLLKLLTILACITSLNVFSMGVNELRLNNLESYNYSSPKVITKDSYGFLWIGTDEGLLKFDGYTYKKYANSPKDSNSLSNGYIRSLLLDSSGRLWIATTNGLNQYDYSSDKFNVYSFGVNEKNFIYDIFESKDKSIWVGTGDGLHRLYNGVAKFEHFSVFVDQFDITKNIDKARTIFQDIDGNL